MKIVDKTAAPKVVDFKKAGTYKDKNSGQIWFVFDDLGGRYMVCLSTGGRAVKVDNLLPIQWVEVDATLTVK